MTYGSVCSGIEAATVAWHPIGWKPAFFAEIDKFPSAVLRHHYPTVPNAGDFTAIGANDYDAIDLLVGGTPCQDFSVAGLREGLGGERGNLTLEFLRLAQRLRPRWLVWENVPGVFSSTSYIVTSDGELREGYDEDGGRIYLQDSEADEAHAFSCFLAGLQELGYGFAYRVLDAQYAGVPQRRRRVFVVGHLGDWRRAAAVLFERHSLSGNPAPRREKGQGFTHDIAPSPTSSGRGVERGGDSRGRDHVVAVASTGDISHCLNAGGMGCQDYETEKDYGADASNDIPPTLRAGGFDKSHANSGNWMAVCYGDLAHTLSLSPALDKGDGGVKQTLVPVAFQEAQTGVREYDTAGTLRADGPGHDPVGTRLRLGMAVRRLTPRECERLQGFPDDYTKISDKTADGPRYKALGNSMAVPVMRWIGERIQMVEELS